ncbi:MAG: nitroreductase family protein [Actinobacteria bacterium]|nr:nitroreductase family protein [Actinomycetota bacterium]MBU1944153.1 nitroreductase family protein [Actinomycetota bacterium]MBU2687472.1 nitroreductase family protein [Actinomycetota bacterium]
MDVLEAIDSRRSIRKYKDKAVPDRLLRQVLEAARQAPSTSNTQSWKFKIVTDDETRHEIRESAYGQRFIEEAPVVIACCLDFEAFKERGKQALKLVLKGVRPSLEMMLRSIKGGKDKQFESERVMVNGIINVSIAAEHMALAATSLGLGTCWVRAFDHKAVAGILDLPDTVALVALLTLGYPAQSPGARPRKPIEDLLLD